MKMPLKAVKKMPDLALLLEKYVAEIRHLQNFKPLKLKTSKIVKRVTFLKRVLRMKYC